MQKPPNLKHPGNPGYSGKPNLKIIGTEENKDPQIRGPVNIINKITES